MLKTFHAGDYLRGFFKEHHLNKASVARDVGISPQSLNGMFSRAKVGDELLVRLSKATGFDVLGAVRKAQASTTGYGELSTPNTMVTEPIANYGRKVDLDLEGLKLTVQLDDYEESVQLQIIRFLQQLPKRKR